MRGTFPYVHSKTLVEVFDVIDGKKTYLLAAGWVAYGVGLYLIGEATADEAFRMVWEGGLAATFRSALAKFQR